MKATSNTRNRVEKKKKQGNDLNQRNDLNTLHVSKQARQQINLTYIHVSKHKSADIVDLAELPVNQRVGNLGFPSISSQAQPRFPTEPKTWSYRVPTKTHG